MALTDEEKRRRRAERDSRYHAEHREARLKRMQAYHAAHKKEQGENRKQWEANNPDKVRESKRKYSQTHSEENKDRNKRWRASNPDRYLLRHLKFKAKQAGVPFDMKYSDLTFPAVCPVLGMPMDYDNVHSDGYPQVDRIVPEKGYVSGNVCLISARANHIKMHGTAQEHRLIADYIDRHTNKIVVEVKSIHIGPKEQAQCQ